MTSFRVAKKTRIDVGHLAIWIAMCLIFLSATAAMAQPKDDTWEAGQVDQYDPTKSSGLLRGSLLVVNRCCKGEHQFEVSSRSPWIIIHPTDALFVLADNAQRFVHPGLDSRSLPPGDHEATISVNCTTCDPGLCDYDVKLRLNVKARQLGSKDGVTQVRVAIDVGTPCTPPPEERLKPGVSKKSCNFRGVYTTKPQITITSNISGQFSDEASRNALGKMADALGTVLDLNTDLGAGNSLRRRESGLGDVVGLWTQWWKIEDVPTSIPEAVGVAGKKALQELQGAMDAMNRVVGERGDKNVDLFAQISVYGADYECAEVERCEQGKWHSLGVTNIPKKISLTPTVRSLPLTINMTDPADRAQKFNQLNQWMKNQRDLPELEQRMKIFESAGPCQACTVMPVSGGGISIPDDPGGGRSCQPILREINEIQDLIFELQAEIDELRRQLPETKKQVANHNARCDAEQTRLNSAANSASAEARRASGALHTATLAGRDTQAAQREVDQANAKHDAAEEARQDHRAGCDQERQRLENKERSLNNSIRQSEVTVAELNARLLTKQREYEDCLRGK